MKRISKTELVVVIAIIVTFIGMKIWVRNKPVNISQGKIGAVFESASKCAHNQKNLYLSMKHYLETNDKLPDDIWDIQSTDNVPFLFFRCTLKDKYPNKNLSYKVFPENYGNPDKVLIAESTNKHKGTFMLWFRDIHPQVQTMGDGTIHLFKDKKVATIDAVKK